MNLRVAPIAQRESRLRELQSVPAALLMVALVLVGWAYFGTYASVVQKWQSDASFSHGFLILPISAWLAWRNRKALTQVTFQPAAVGVLAVLFCTFAWIIARGAGVLVLQQFAAIAMIPAMVLAALGWPATRVLLVPLGFLFFMVPFGRGIVPILMQATADMATVGLQWSGVPVFQSHTYITIPGGSFEVARVCSGLNYFITSLVLGALYAYLNYKGWRKRAICIAVVLTVPVMVNWLRVYVIIFVSHLTDMRFGPGSEHIVFGRVLYLLVILLLFWFGRRWHDDAVPGAGVTSSAMPAKNDGSWVSSWPLVLACLFAVSAPPLAESSIANVRQTFTDSKRLVALPVAHGWSGPQEASGWRPHYSGGVEERWVRYETTTGAPVDVFVAVYGLGATLGTEMISYNNTISVKEFGSLAPDARRAVDIPGRPSLVVREIVVDESPGQRLVWHWYVVGNTPVTGQFKAKALEAFAFVTRSASSERVVVISTLLDDEAPERLRAFVEATSDCVAAGFADEACTG